MRTPSGVRRPCCVLGGTSEIGLAVADAWPDAPRPPGRPRRPARAAARRGRHPAGGPRLPGRGRGLRRARRRRPRARRAPGARRRRRRRGGRGVRRPRRPRARLAGRGEAAPDRRGPTTPRRCSRRRPRRSDARQGHGVVVALSCVAGERPRRSNFVYGSSKAGMDAFYTGLGEALRRHGGRVLVVRPGFVRSRMTEGLRRAPGRPARGRRRAIVNGVRKGRHSLGPRRDALGHVRPAPHAARGLPPPADLSHRRRAPSAAGPALVVPATGRRASVDAAGVRRGADVLASADRDRLPAPVTAARRR